MGPYTCMSCGEGTPNESDECDECAAEGIASMHAMTTTQERAARLTEVEQEIVSIMAEYDRQYERNKGYVDTPGGLEHMGDVWRLLGDWRDRLTAAPAQVTREEIALWLWKFSARSSGTLKSTWESFDLSNHWNPSELLQEADGFISFLAERGLVKEA